MGPFKILEHVGPVAYRLALTPEFGGLHNVFYVSMLKRYHHNAHHVIPHQQTLVHSNMTYMEYLAKIIDQRDKVLRDMRILTVKVLWQHHTPKEATWELEDEP